MKAHGQKMCEKMDCQVTFEITVPSNHPAYSKNYKKEAGPFRKIKMPSNNFDVSTEFPPYPPLPKEEQAKFHRLPKEKKVLNIDLRNKGVVDCDSEGQNCYKKFGNIYTGKPKDPSRLTLKLDANTFDRMANSEFGGLRAFFTGKL